MAAEYIGRSGVPVGTCHIWWLARHQIWRYRGEGWLGVADSEGAY